MEEMLKKDLYERFLREINGWSITVKQLDEDGAWDDLITKDQAILAFKKVINYDYYTPN